MAKLPKIRQQVAAQCQSRIAQQLPRPQKSDTLPAIKQEMDNWPSYHSEPRLVIWDTLEKKRAQRLGLKPLKNFNITRDVATYSRRGAVCQELPPLVQSPNVPQLQPLQGVDAAALIGLTRSNTIAPFGTMAPKPTCGYYFDRDTLNRKVRIGIPSSDLVKWRSEYGTLVKQA